MRATIIAAALALLSNLTVAAPANHAVHEARDLESHPVEWVKRSRAHNLQVLPMRVALKQRNLEHGERFLMDVADPASPNFGKHWTAEEVANTFMPSEDTINQVKAWLERSGIHLSRVVHAKGHNWLEFDSTVEEAEQLLNTEYHVYEHTPTGRNQAACDDYKLPHELRDHVDFVMPTIQLDSRTHLQQREIMRRHESNLGSSHVAVAKAASKPITGLTGTKNCDVLITIDCLRAIYNIPKPKPGVAPQKGNEMGIAEWSDYLYRPDLKIFFQNYTDPQIPSDVFPEFISIDGGSHANKSVVKHQEVIESALDFQTAYSIIYPQKIRLYQNGDSVNVNSVGTFNIFLDALDASYCTFRGGDSKKHDPHYPDPKPKGFKGPLQCGGAPHSKVYSFSYLQTEVDLPPFYQHRQCHEWMKLGLQGVSVFFASGDSGVAMRFNVGFPNKCLAEHSDKKLVDGKRFNPGFPANCPYVTAVGATDLLTNNINGGEKAVKQLNKKNPHEDFFSGGGFSNVFHLPSYQKKAVNNYMKNFAPNYGPNIYNQSGNARAYPDVSSLGLNLATVFDAQILGVGGTSASTPTVAAIVNLLNEKRLAAGKSTLGFLNPIIYSNMDAFNDVTKGHNGGCGSQGFPAAPGWDPVTGVGTPDYNKLLKVVMALP